MYRKTKLIGGPENGKTINVVPSAVVVNLRFGALYIIEKNSRGKYVGVWQNPDSEGYNQSIEDVKQAIEKELK